MALGRQRDRQAEMLVTWSEMPRSPGHVFYDRLQAILMAAGFDGFVEELCASHYADGRGRPSLPPGRYFRMHMIGYFEGIDSERGIDWRCADSLSLREFLRLAERETGARSFLVVDARARVCRRKLHEKVFGWVLKRVSEHGLVKGERIGVDASTMEANAALRTIVRRDSGEGYREMLTRMAKESGIATPTVDDLVRLDREAQGQEAVERGLGEPDRSGREDRQDEGRPTHLAYKPEHAVDLDTGAIVAADPPRRPGRHDDPAGHARSRRRSNLAALDAAPDARGRRRSWSPTKAIIRATR